MAYMVELKKTIRNKYLWKCFFSSVKSHFTSLHFLSYLFVFAQVKHNDLIQLNLPSVFCLLIYFIRIWIWLWRKSSWQYWLSLNTLRPIQNGRHFADDIFKCIFLNENTSISISVSLTFVPEGLINNISALVQIMAWRRLGDKPLSEPMMVSLLTHICVTRHQWVKVATSIAGHFVKKNYAWPVKCLSKAMLAENELRYIYISLHIHNCYDEISSIVRCRNLLPCCWPSTYSDNDFSTCCRSISLIEIN